MINNTKFEKITLVENGLILNYKSKTIKEILFSELDKIYITINKIKPVYTLLISLSAICLALFSYLVLKIDIILLLAFLSITAIILKMNNFKNYGLIIRLKNTETFEKQVSTKSKHETIDLVNDIQKEIYNYKIKKSNEAEL
jgi:hypothetical protein